LNGEQLSPYHVVRRWVGRTICTGLLFLAPAEAQLLAETTLPEAPSATKQILSRARNPIFPAYGGSPQQDQTQVAHPHDSDRGFVALIKRGAQDQKEIYTAPFHRKNLKWDALFLLATGGLIAADNHATGAISHGNLSVSQDISDIGLYSTMATTGVLYLSGILKKDEHAREAGFLAFEAAGNILVVDAVTQLITGRERPLEGAGQGRFWVNNAFDSSFPSQHSGLTWSMATVLAHEYPKPWVQFLAYGTATTVSVTRVTGLKHFPADVFVGGVFGYLIGQHIFNSHSHFSRRHREGAERKSELRSAVSVHRRSDGEADVERKTTNGPQALPST
jgi:membrane-associated phospholipid phosphatase